jgi:hypothetical protein
LAFVERFLSFTQTRYLEGLSYYPWHDDFSVNLVSSAVDALMRDGTVSVPSCSGIYRALGSPESLQLIAEGLPVMASTLIQAHEGAKDSILTNILRIMDSKVVPDGAWSHSKFKHT